jgi:hypothetical protein
MKKLICCLIMMVPAAAIAEEAPMLDFSAFFAKSRVGYSVDQHMSRSTVLYSAFKRYNAKAGVELANLNFGYDMGNKHPVVMLGVRLDNADRLIWSGNWSRKHIETAPLPVVEFGPHISAWPRTENGKMHLDTWYGFILAVGIK